MQAEFFALVAAMGWAVNGILVRKGSRTADVFGAVLLSFLATAIFLWSYLILSQSLHLVRSPAAVYFVLSGLMQPMATRVLSYIGVARLGVSRAAPLRNTDSLVAVLIAVIFLHEHPSSFVYLGTVLTVAGAWTVLSGRDEKGQFKLFDALFPLSAALLAAVSQNLRRMGLLILPNPFAGAAITTTTSLVLFSIYMLISGKIRTCRADRASFPYYGSAAIVSVGAQFYTFAALNKGDVSVVVPLLSTVPLFSIFLSFVFIRSLESITLRVVIGAVLIVAGVIFITSG